MSEGYRLRRAIVAEAGVLAEQRMLMFRAMGRIRPEDEAPLVAAAASYYAVALASEEYVGWLAVAEDGKIVGGAGVQFRPLIPRPADRGNGVAVGREGLVMNVYTDPAWRRRGIARRLMEEIIAWAKGVGIVRLVLHASDEGRPLYEQLGFAATNEMRYRGELAARG